MNKILAMTSAFFAIAMILQIAVNDSMIREIRTNRETLATLKRIIDKQGTLIDHLRTRMTKLERPDEPVYPPRHPGRLGTIDSSAVGSIDP